MSDKRITTPVGETFTYAGRTFRVVNSTAFCKSGDNYCAFFGHCCKIDLEQDCMYNSRPDGLNVIFLEDPPPAPHK